MPTHIPLQLDYSYLLPEVTAAEIASWQAQVTLAEKKLQQKTGLGRDYLGWMDTAALMPASLLNDIKKTAQRMREHYETMVVIGIGGSYLGARTVIEALDEDGGSRVCYAGHTLSPHYLTRLQTRLEKENFCINVISKSGTTTEPAVAFRLLREQLQAKVGNDEAVKRIVATTDPEEGALRQMADSQGYKTFTIPRNVGGRYSVFSAVGMLPIAYAGIDVDALITGANDCASACSAPEIANNLLYTYAIARNLLYQKGKAIELLAFFEPRLHFMAEWWKQLYGESEGKNLQGLFPASVEFTTDLHSMGQIIQQGRRNIFETYINIAGGAPALKVPFDAENADQLNFLAGMEVATVNQRAFQGTALAHREGGVPNMTITMEKLDAYNLGALLYFYEKACAISGYLLGINPFDQPGVESYKNNMFALLNKPGFEKEHGEVLARVEENTGKNVVTFKDKI